MELEALRNEIREVAPTLSEQLARAAAESHNEAEFRTRVARYIEEFAERLDLTIPLREEYTLINGRADAVYNRLIVEYEPPGSLRPENSYHANRHAIDQVKNYISGLSRRERHKPERLAGVALDGSYFIFVRYKEGVWHTDEPLKVAPSSTERFLQLLASLSTELALIPENLIRDFGENTVVSRKAVGTFYEALEETQNPRAKTLFEQWSLQFSEVCDYSQASKLNVERFARAFGVKAKEVEPFRLFFAIHTYYATFIKLLAIQIVHFYMMPRLGTDLRQAATLGSAELKSYMERVEEGGLFRDLGIMNFLEADFFRWYLDIWDEAIYEAVREIITQLASYSLVTLDVDPEETRDLLKKLYQNLMPKQLRHNLGEYYTPDWLAERLLVMLCGERKGEKHVADIRPEMRLLDPACGSGTFLVIAIKRIREYAEARMLPEAEVLEKILANVVGFDLNPLAVISARTNYLLALGDLLQHRKGEINIPVYLCDSIMTPSEGEDLLGKGIMRLPRTAVGPFELPKSLVEAKLIDRLANFLEEAVEAEFSREQFVARLAEGFPLSPEKDRGDIEVVYGLYDKLLRLKRQGINGIWARIVKNAFAPLFCGKFDYVVGNPPWVNWENLPEEYRQEMIPLYEEVYNLFPHIGFRRRHGSTKIDISSLMAYVALHKYLNNDGKLGFLITQSVFKADAGKGFRQFKLPDGTPVKVLHVDDMVELQPFEGATNRTSLVILQKGRPTKYPVSYLYWKKTTKGKAIALDSTLKEVSKMTARKEFVAEPVDESDPTSPWITGRPKALRAIRKILGRSDYTAHAGCYTGGANGVYWVEIVAKRPDGLVVISNITEGAKREVEEVQAVIEPDLLYPLLRGRDVRRWRAEPSAWIIVPQNPLKPDDGYPEERLKIDYPKTYLYLKRFEKPLRDRSAYKKYLKPEGEPFYALYDIKAYTFAPWKVVWREQASTLTTSVVDPRDGKAVVPDHKLMLMGCSSAEEAHFACACLNSSIGQMAAISYAVEIQMDPHILEHIRVPHYNPDDPVHRQLAELSQQAHELAAQGEERVEELKEVEEEIDALVARLWGLTEEELREIKTSLEELR
jgi:SAM-dependent methyltransferase